jgi:hypothetical protein
MSRLVPCALLVCLLWPGLSFAQTDTKKEEPKPNEAEVRFADGSAVRVQVLQENLEIETKYGKLSVPTNQIRRIEFGARLPDDIAKKVEAAIKKLGDAAFAEREAAVKELVALGAHAYPTLQVAAKGGDAETVRRAQAALEQIREKVSPDQLTRPAYDHVQAAEFPFTGRIVSSGIKVKTTYFGDVELKISDLRSIRWVAVAGEVTVAVDAAKYGSPPGQQWLETEVQVSAGDGLRITATGQVDLWPQQPGAYMAKASGYGQAGIGVPAVGALAPGMRAQQVPGLLIGRIGPNGKPFVIGELFEGKVTEEGKLYLQIGISPWGNASSGAYEVKISTGHYVSK